MKKQIPISVVGAFVVAAALVVTYHPALRLGFFADDYRWLDRAGRLALPDYLREFFDPFAQTQWYRPLQGMQWKITYALFGADPTGYHWVNVLLHLAACLLLYRIVGRVTQRWATAAVSATLFACLTVIQADNPNGELAPLDFWLYNLAVLWPAVVDPLEAVFYLFAINSWVAFLEKGERWHFLLALAANILALLCKEVGITLGIVLFLTDRWVIGKPAKPVELVRRYAPFFLVLFAYLPIAYLVQSQSVFTEYIGYGLGIHIASNLVHYLQATALPWAMTEWLSRIGLLLGILAFLYFAIIKRNARVIFAAAGVMVTLLPTALFPFVVLRYLYLPLMLFAVALASGVDAVHQILQQREWSLPFIGGAIATLIVANGEGVAAQSVDFSRLILKSHAPFTPMLAPHSRFPEDTFLYFVDPPMLSQDLAGLFLLKYGPSVRVKGTDQGVKAGLHDHSHAYVVYFDDQGRLGEQPVRAPVATSTQPSLPVKFEALMRLEGYELANDRIQRDDVIVLVLYWRAAQKMDKNYSIFTHLVNSKGERIEGYDGEPQGGRAPTSSWKPERLAVTAAVIPVPANAPPGDDYRLEVGVYDQLTMQRLSVVDAQGQPIDDKIVIKPLSVVD